MKMMAQTASALLLIMLILEITEALLGTMPAAPFVCDLDTASDCSFEVYLFKNVTNALYIRQQIIEGKWKCAAIKPSLIVDPFQVAVAANKAVVSEKFNTMVTKTVYSEILFNLGLSKNISQSLSRFGIENDNTLLLCFFKHEEEDESDAIISKIEGDLCPIIDLQQFCDLQEVKKVYKLSSKCHSDADLLDIIVSKMVTKNVVSH